MVVECGICCALEVGWDNIGAANEDAEDVVMLGVGLILVEGNEEECAVHEVSIVKERVQPAAEPVPSEGNVGVVSVVRHVWSDESPLREGLVVDVVHEAGEVLDH